MGFAYTANLVFGNWLPEYHKFLTSFNTLLRVPLGDFDYPALARVRTVCRTHSLCIHAPWSSHRVCVVLTRLDLPLHQPSSCCTLPWWL